jgi:hypothetical protein
MRYNFGRKKEILDFIEKNLRHSQRSLANHFSISLGAINKIIKNSALIKSEPVIDVQKRKRTKSILCCMNGFKAKDKEILLSAAKT